MILENKPSRQKLNLDRYLSHNIPSHKNEVFTRQYNEGLLRLVFAYVRKQHNLHLRRDRKASIELAFLTVEELFRKKKKDPTLNKIYDRLVENNNLPDAKLKELLLETADRILNGTAARNRVISIGPRKRKEHPLKTIMREVVEDHPQLNHQILRGKAILLAKNKNMIDKDDVEKKRVIFLDENIKTITYGTIEKWAKDLKNNLDLTG
jgi:hypothetical protein